MQDLIFYVAAKETLGKVRDYSNMRSSDAPLLTLGVAVCLRMRLFEDIEDSTPYPIASFDSITSWNWRMDADYDRRTACKLVADAEGISVHTVTDTIKSETMSFTEVVIPISNMNTRELAAWIDNEKIKTGLAGELVGYDNEGHAAFVLQIENFSVRNRLSGLNDEDEDDPIPVDQEIVTRPLAEQMIQAAVSASAATKQDKLTSGNAGTGISISNAGVISTENVPQSAVTGLSVSLASKQDKLTSGNAGAGISISDNGIISVRVDSIPQSSVVGLESALNNKQNSLSTGFWIEIDDDWISVERYHAIHGPYSRGSITLQAGEAYKIFATNSVVTLDAESIPNNTWGLDGYLEIFVANTGYVQTTSRVVLANALEPDAVNNCRVEFRDGLCTITMENTLAGYIVTLTAGTGEGSLPYALSVSSSEYVAFDASLNGTTIDLAGAVAEDEKHVVGNGYAETTLTGAVDCGTSKFTVANLGLQNVQVTGGIMTLGDAYIPSGSTVAVSGGGLAIEKVTGEGSESVILTSDTIQVGAGSIASASGVRITKSVSSTYGAFYVSTGASLVLHDCECANVSATFRGGIAYVYNSGTVLMYNCNIHNLGGDAICLAGSNASCYISGCTFDSTGRLRAYQSAGGMQYTFAGSNAFEGAVPTESCTVTLASGAIVDLTGNTNATPIAPEGGITFEPGGATVYPSAGQASAYMLGGMTVPTIGNTNVVNLNSSNVVISSGGTAYASGCTITGGGGGTTLNGGAFHVSRGATLNLNSVDLTGNGGNQGGAFYIVGTVKMSSSIVSGNTPSNVGKGAFVLTELDMTDCSFADQIFLRGGTASVIMRGSNTFGGYFAYDSGGGAVTLASGAILDLTGNTNATPINPGGSVIVNGSCQVITSAGTTVSIAGGTYTKINNDGTTN